MKRETGYYWIKIKGGKYDADEWEVAYYEVLPDRNVWTRMWFEDEFTDKAFIDINEERIKMPNEI